MSPLDALIGKMQHVGAILIILPEHKEAAERLLQSQGFAPAAIRSRPDGNVEFVFGKEVEQQLWPLFKAVPENFHAFRGVLGGIPPLPNFE